MSDRLAVSASLSVLMMSIYVLFGSEAAHAPIGPGQLSAPYEATALGLTGKAAQSLVPSR